MFDPIWIMVFYVGGLVGAAIGATLGEAYGRRCERMVVLLEARLEELADE